MVPGKTDGRIKEYNIIVITILIIRKKANAGHHSYNKPDKYCYITLMKIKKKELYNIVIIIKIMNSVTG